MTLLTKEKVYDGHMAVVSADDFSYIVVADEEGKTAVETGFEEDLIYDEPVPTPTPKPHVDDPDTPSNPDNPDNPPDQGDTAPPLDGEESQTGLTQQGGDNK